MSTIDIDIHELPANVLFNSFYTNLVILYNKIKDKLSYLKFNQRIDFNKFKSKYDETRIMLSNYFKKATSEHGQKAADGSNRHPNQFLSIIIILLFNLKIAENSEDVAHDDSPQEDEDLFDKSRVLKDACIFDYINAMFNILINSRSNDELDEDLERLCTLCDQTINKILTSKKYLKYKKKYLYLKNKLNNI